MKNKIANIIKYNRCIYILYYYLISLLINFLKLFVHTDQKLILFNSFAGRKYDDSPKAIFEVMRVDHRFKEYHFVWAFHNPEKFEVKGAKKIKTDGLEYFITTLWARVWITNSSVERGLNFKGKDTLYFNTWHGTALKKMGSDIDADNQSFRSKGANHIDIMMSQGPYDTDIFSQSFGIARDKFLEAGLPRNDILANYTEIMRNSIKRKLNIPEDKKVLLYCPTFREYEKDSNYGIVLKPPMNLNKWESKLSPKYILLFRAHYEVTRIMDVQNNFFVLNMTDYPNLNDLMIISDVLISDYSSIFFDYSITDKPMFHFTYDYDIYSKNRGMYFDIREYIDGATNEDELIDLLLTYNENGAKEKTIKFRQHFISFFGHASESAVDCIADRLSL